MERGAGHGLFYHSGDAPAARDLPPALFPSVFGGLCAGGRQSSKEPGGVPALDLERGKEGGLAHTGAGTMSAQAARRYCGREFSPAELDRIGQLLELKPVLGRVALSRRICQDLGWLNVLGQPKEMSCRVALLRMEKNGLISLPPPLTRGGGGQRRFQLSAASDPRESVQASVQALEPLVFQRVEQGSF